MEMSEYQEAIKELEWRREVAPNGRTDVPGHLEWKVGVLSALESIFGEGSRPVREFVSSRGWLRG